MSKSIKFGIYLPIPTTPVDKLVNIARINEEAGFESVWVPDHILFMPSGDFVPDAWTFLSAVAVKTENALLGTCVSDPHRFHPAVLAQKVATVDQISKGRAILGLGAGESMNLDPFGIKWDKPVSRLIEAVRIIRKFWSSEPFDYDGKFWRLKDAFLQIKPVRDRVPIYFAANSTRMLKLTGELADGWLPLPLSPKLYKNRLEIIKKSAIDKGRSIDDIEPNAYLYTAISDDREEAYSVIDSMKSLIIPQPSILKDAGYDIPDDLLSANFTKISPTDQSLLEKYIKYTTLIPTKAAIEFSITGNVEDCIKKIESYRDAGVKHLSLINMGPNPKHTLEIYSKEIIPQFKDV
ncbi:MAG: LLM class flavin-dependent oxidoreductase [Candidatus Methanoliparum thermophilum]|uniref:LLM class flavin-dependent oxidoreductase n=1 Tax=Methanoliparum thermophilum TaxID=2491083 RepID=A0A520KTP1_METT2|nr:LLM class flavin-dependent oxidoreductase [Candidatus Methanoliparum sp. LAM-1]RZN65410.1 MAG: LLM class flavin-dependent oxidoreductase [Candidatus Methanoliparum thermophilum]BDC35501.1 N5,N10-methylene tetrahydromethanopterin reductase [Candidatus Methanoliparum sp. LAM-1]